VLPEPDPLPEPDVDPLPLTEPLVEPLPLADPEVEPLPLVDLSSMVLAAELDQDWWNDYRKTLEELFRQEEIVICAQQVWKL
jgi:hypothetical protein